MRKVVWVMERCFGFDVDVRWVMSKTRLRGLGWVEVKYVLMYQSAFRTFFGFAKDLMSMTRDAKASSGGTYNETSTNCSHSP